MWVFFFLFCLPNVFIVSAVSTWFNIQVKIEWMQGAALHGLFLWLSLSSWCHKTHCKDYDNARSDLIYAHVE